MATHSSILAWRIPRTEEPGGPQPAGSQESDMPQRLIRSSPAALTENPVFLSSSFLFPRAPTACHLPVNTVTSSARARVGRAPVPPVCSAALVPGTLCTARAIRRTGPPSHAPACVCTPLCSHSVRLKHVSPGFKMRLHV